MVWMDGREYGEIKTKKKISFHPYPLMARKNKKWIFRISNSKEREELPKAPWCRRRSRRRWQKEREGDRHRERSSGRHRSERERDGERKDRDKDRERRDKDKDRRDRDRDRERERREKDRERERERAERESCLKFSVLLSEEREQLFGFK